MVRVGRRYKLLRSQSPFSSAQAGGEGLCSSSDMTTPTIDTSTTESTTTGVPAAEVPFGVNAMRLGWPAVAGRSGHRSSAFAVGVSRGSGKVLPEQLRHRVRDYRIPYPFSKDYWLNQRAPGVG